MGDLYTQERWQGQWYARVREGMPEYPYSNEQVKGFCSQGNYDMYMQAKKQRPGEWVTVRTKEQVQMALREKSD